MMKFSYQIPVALIGAVVCLVQPQLAIALTLQEIQVIAEEITVKIDGAGTGSGVIFDRQGNKYFVLTCRHVFYNDKSNEFQAGQYEIQTSDGNRYPIYNRKEIPGLDLAVVEFESNKNYRIAKLGDSDKIIGSAIVYASGWTAKQPKTEKREYSFNVGSFIERRSTPEGGGYALVVNNTIFVGMSGGPLLDEKGFLIGINGLRESPDDRALRLAIPIKTFLAARNNPVLSPPAVALQPTAEDLLTLGISKANSGNYEEAIAAYNRVLQISPNNVDAYLQRGIAYIEQNKYQAAIADMTEVIKLNPNNSRAYFWRGLARDYSEDNQGALEDYSHAIRLDPEYSGAYNNRGTVYAELGEYQKAILDYTEAIRLDPDVFLAYENRGDARYSLKDYQGAISDYTQALNFLEYSGLGFQYRRHESGQGLIITKIFENSPAFKQGLILDDLIIAINGKSTLNKSAEDLVELTVNQMSSESVTQVTLKLRRKDRGDFDVTLTKENIAVPRSASIYFGRGNARYYLKDYKGSISDYNEAIKRNPKYAAAYRERADARDELGEHQEAIKDLNQAISLNPKDARAYFLRGWIHSNRFKAYQEALKDYNQAILNDPQYHIAYFERGLIHRELGDNRGAINDHTQVIRLVPDWADAYYNRGLSYRDLEEKPKALEDFKKAAELYKQQNRKEDYQDAIDRIKELLSGRV